jgi:hypothetical protein
VLLFVFVDGVGIGRRGPENPFDDLGGPILSLLAGRDPELPANVVHAPSDACLGTCGLPQSATGQATLFTGTNASGLLGRHLWGFPNERLRALLAQRSFLKVAKEAGRSVAFLNPFPPGYLQAREPSRIGCSTWAALASGEPLRTPQDLLDGRAVGYDLTGDRLRARGWPAPRRTAFECGRILVRAARELDLAMYEYFLTDEAGHSRDARWGRLEARRLRDLVDGILTEMGPTDRLCLTSDHGNLEDLSTPSHTRNAVPTIWAGPGAALHAASIRGLTDVAPAVLRALGVDPLPPSTRHHDEISPAAVP